mgnify:CR=1 FL=1
MAAMEALFSILVTFVEFVFRPSSRLFPIHLLAMIVISFLLYLRTARSTSFVKWIFPKQTYAHPSHRTDLKLFVLGQFLTFIGLFKLIAITTAVATTVMGLLGGPLDGVPKFGALPVTIVLIFALDFTVYWVHRLHHETPALWPFHAVHHSAEVMTPVTVYRKHPVYDVISLTSKGLLGGVLQGLLLAMFVDEIQVATIASANAGYFIFNIVGANLRHSHIWLSYPQPIEHILISPAQHQIHHSIEARHFNKNYGEVFAFWDWMFGTLYVPSAHETLRYGLADGSGAPVEQPHTGLRAALSVPIEESWRTIRGTAERPAGSPEPEHQLTGTNE